MTTTRERSLFDFHEVVLFDAVRQFPVDEALIAGARRRRGNAEERQRRHPYFAVRRSVRQTPLNVDLVSFENLLRMT